MTVALSHADIVAYVQNIGTATEIEQRRERCARTRRSTGMTGLAGFGLTFLLLPTLFYSATLNPAPWYVVACSYASVVSMLIAGIGSCASILTPAPSEYTPLSELRLSRQALELVERSANARLVRDLVLQQGRRLVGRDFNLMQQLAAQEDAAKHSVTRQVEEDVASARLHTPSSN